MRAAGEGALGSDQPRGRRLQRGVAAQRPADQRRRSGPAAPPLRVGIAPAGSSYVFNASGQTIDLAGLLCLFDADGPCANAVKDAQRTKTHAETRATLNLVWGASALSEHRADANARVVPRAADKSRG